jgi:hypothetical protein
MLYTIIDIIVITVAGEVERAEVGSTVFWAFKVFISRWFMKYKFYRPKYKGQRRMLVWT